MQLPGRASRAMVSSRRRALPSALARARRPNRYFVEAATAEHAGGCNRRPEAATVGRRLQPQALQAGGALCAPYLPWPPYYLPCYYTNGAQPQRPVPARSEHLLALSSLGAPLTGALRPHHRRTLGQLLLICPRALRTLLIIRRAPRPRGRGAGGVGAITSGTLRPCLGRRPVGRVVSSGRHGPSRYRRCGRRRPGLLPGLLLRRRLPHPRLLRPRLRCRRGRGLRSALRSAHCADRVDPVSRVARPALATDRPAKPRRSASGVSWRHSGTDASGVGEPATAHRG